MLRLTICCLLLAACRSDLDAQVDPVLKAAAELEKADATTMTEAAAAVQEAHALEGEDADDAELARAGAYEELINAHEARFKGKATLTAQKKKWGRFRLPWVDHSEAPRKAAARLQEQGQKAVQREQHGKHTARVQEQSEKKAREQHEKAVAREQHAKAIAEQAQKRAATQTQWDKKMRALRTSCKVGSLACSKTCGTGQQQM